MNFYMDGKPGAASQVVEFNEKRKMVVFLGDSNFQKQISYIYDNKFILYSITPAHCNFAMFEQ